MRKARAVLGLSGSSDEVALKKAYRLKALECHPDKVAAHNKEWATAEMQHVNWAYKCWQAHGGGAELRDRSPQAMSCSSCCSPTVLRNTVDVDRNLARLGGCV